MSALDALFQKLDDYIYGPDDNFDGVNVYEVAKQELSALRAEIARKDALLRESEWAAYNDEWGQKLCWCCGAWEGKHKKDCKLAEELK